MKSKALKRTASKRSDPHVVHFLKRMGLACGQDFMCANVSTNWALVNCPYCLAEREVP